MDYITLTDEFVLVAEASKGTGITLKSVCRFRK
jgi:hypothetical protein